MFIKPGHKNAHDKILSIIWNFYKGKFIIFIIAESFFSMHHLGQDLIAITTPEI